MKIFFLCIFFILFLSSVSFATCDYTFQETNDAVTSVQSLMVEKFPFSVIVTAGTILSGIMELTPEPIYNFSYTLWGTEYFPLSMFQSEYMDLFFTFVRWCFLLLILGRLSVLVMTHIF